jgi:homogentisate 1,2-dioxygenase
MNKDLAPDTLRQAASPVGTTEGYMPGFGNDFETEALPGALPQGMNSPQKVNYGLYLLRLAIRMSALGAIASVLP